MFRRQPLRIAGLTREEVEIGREILRELKRDAEKGDIPVEYSILPSYGRIDLICSRDFRDALREDIRARA